MSTTAAPIAAACDGACKGNPGPGGWGWLIRLADGRALEASGGRDSTTNNRMELEAAAALLEALAGLRRPASQLEALTDSRYVIDGLTRHLPRWRRNGWRTTTGQPVRNRDLWERLAAAAARVPWVSLRWIKGHAGHADNERADALASAAADQVAVKAAAAQAAQPVTPTPAGLLPHHWGELERSGIAPDVAAANVCSWGPGTDRHWETERAELIAHARLLIQTGSTTASGHPQAQPGHLADRLIRLQQRYRHLSGGGWRSMSEPLEGVPPFDQWKPDQPRPRADRPGRVIRYEAPPSFPGGGGLLLPRVPNRCWALICDRHGLPFPDDATRAAGFWPWAAATPALPVVICEGWKKALALLTIGRAAVALPGVQMGRRVGADGTDRLIPALRALSARHGRRRCSFPTADGRRWLIAFDAEARPATAAKVAAAAGALARCLRGAGGRVEIARLPLLPGTDKTGADDLLAEAGPEALERALGETAPRPVLPKLRAADVVAPAGAWLGDAAPYPASEAAGLVVVQAPMGCGKTRAAATALAPLQAVGVPILLPSHRQALGQAAAAAVGVPWCPEPSDDLERRGQRLQGIAACLDSWCPSSRLQITGDGWSGGVMVADELMQQLEHLLASTGTALGDSRRVAVLQTLAEQLPRLRQVIAMDAQLADWGVRLLERLTGRRAWLIRSEHRPMAGRPLHCPEGPPADGFRVKLAELIDAAEPGGSLLVWSSAQRAGMRNAAQTLAEWHRQHRRPRALAPALAVALGTAQGPALAPGLALALAAHHRADLIDVIDSTTPELAAQLAADPDRFAEQRIAEAKRQGVAWVLYCSPAISSGISFERWRPTAVIAMAGGRIAPEHAAQALARVRCPEVPAYLFAPERCPGAALRVGSGATDPAQLIRDLRAVSDPLLGLLEAAGADGAWLEAWADLAAVRNRQRHAYRASLAALLVAEGWELQATEAAPDPQAAAVLAEQLAEVAAAALAAEDAALLEAEPLTTAEAAELARRRTLEPAERAALARHRLAERWALGAAAPTPELLEADRDGLAERLRLGWLLTTPEAMALIPGHDQQRIAALAPGAQPFAPDRLRVALAPRVAALQALGVPRLLERLAGGETIAATDPAVLQLHTLATAHRGQLLTALGVSPRKLPSGTLRALLEAIGWKLEKAGRIKARGGERDAYTYRAQRLALPAGVDPEALAAAWLEALRRPPVPAGAKTPPIQNPYRGKKSPTPPPGPPPPPRISWPAAAVVPIPWAAGPPPPPRSAPQGFGRPCRRAAAACC